MKRQLEHDSAIDFVEQTATASKRDPYGRWRHSRDPVVLPRLAECLPAEQLAGFEKVWSSLSPCIADAVFVQDTGSQGRLKTLRRAYDAVYNLNASGLYDDNNYMTRLLFQKFVAHFVAQVSSRVAKHGLTSFVAIMRHVFDEWLPRLRFVLTPLAPKITDLMAVFGSSLPGIVERAVVSSLLETAGLQTICFAGAQQAASLAEVWWQGTNADLPDAIRFFRLLRLFDDGLAADLQRSLCMSCSSLFRSEEHWLPGLSAESQAGQFLRRLRVLIVAWMSSAPDSAAGLCLSLGKAVEPHLRRALDRPHTWPDGDVLSTSLAQMCLLLGLPDLLQWMFQQFCSTKVQQHMGRAPSPESRPSEELRAVSAFVSKEITALHRRLAAASITVKQQLVLVAEEFPLLVEALGTARAAGVGHPADYVAHTSSLFSTEVRRAMRSVLSHPLAQYYSISEILAFTVFSSPTGRGCLGDVVCLCTFLDSPSALVQPTIHVLGRRLLLERRRTLSGHEQSAVDALLRVLPENGASLQSGVQRMVQDLSISTEIAESFLAGSVRVSRAPPPSFQVLCQSYWQEAGTLACMKVPSALLDECTQFQAFFKTVHPNRKLTWSWALSTCLMVSTLGGQMRLLSGAALPQALLLLMFNDIDSHDSSFLADALGVTCFELRGILSSLCSPSLPLLEMVPAPGTGPVPVYTVRVNAQFSSARSKLLMPELRICSQVEDSRQGEDAQRQPAHVDPQRSTVERAALLDATIVRIMKSEKRIKFDALVATVVGALPGSWVPEVREIKRQVELLIDREFLARADVDYLIYN